MDLPLYALDELDQVIDALLAFISALLLQLVDLLLIEVDAGVDRLVADHDANDVAVLPGQLDR